MAPRIPDEIISRSSICRHSRHMGMSTTATNQPFGHWEPARTDSRTTRAKMLEPERRASEPRHARIMGVEKALMGESAPQPRQRLNATCGQAGKRQLYDLHSQGVNRIRCVITVHNPHFKLVRHAHAPVNITGEEELPPVHLFVAHAGRHGHVGQGCHTAHGEGEVVEDALGGASLKCLACGMTPPAAGATTRM